MLLKNSFASDFITSAIFGLAVIGLSVDFPQPPVSTPSATRLRSRADSRTRGKARSRRRKEADFCWQSISASSRRRLHFLKSALTEEREGWYSHRLHPLR